MRKACYGTIGGMQLIRKMARMFAMCAVLTIALSSCGMSDDETLGIGAFINAARLSSACRMPLEELKVTSHDEFTVGKLKDKAYVVGYHFICASNITGKTPWNIYVGWVHANGMVDCIHWNEDRKRVIDGGWLSCGGLNPR